jgi:hypothetical protein
VPQSVTSATGAPWSAGFARVLDLRREEERLLAGHPERAGDGVGAREREDHDRDHEQHRAPAEADDVGEAELQAEEHDADPHQPLRRQREPGLQRAGERGPGSGDLRRDDPERDRDREQRDRGDERVHGPRDERRGGRGGEAGERGVDARGGGGHQIQPEGIHACSRQNQVGTSCPVQRG